MVKNVNLSQTVFAQCAQVGGASTRVVNISKTLGLHFGDFLSLEIFYNL